MLSTLHGALRVSLVVALFGRGGIVEADSIAAQTVYLHDGIEGYHRIQIEGELGGTGRLWLDPNKCSVNEFGDSTACTLIGLPAVPITLTNTQKPDPDGTGRTLYLLEGTGLQNPLFVAIWPDAAHPPRLIYNHRGSDAPMPITLEPLPQRATVSEKCEGQYSAAQVPGAVLVFATGVHGAAGFQTFFEELPITIFPPEFQLLHTPPTGPSTQVVTPFLVYTRFPAEEQLERVVVHDAKGRHEITVEQVPDLK